MRIDCESCPARNRACDGCMMQVFLEPVTSEYVTKRDNVDLLTAVDVFADTAMISVQSARNAREVIHAGESVEMENQRNWLRAV